MKLLCLSKDGWDKRCGRKQQLMAALAHGDPDSRIAYVVPPRASPLPKKARLIPAEDLDSFLVPAQNLHVIQPYRPPFDRIRPVRERGRHRMLRSVLTAVGDIFGSSAPDVLWIYNPWDAVLLDAVPDNMLKVVDWTEDWPTLYAASGTRMVAQMKHAQEKMLRDADVVFAASPPLAESAARLNEEVHLLPNASNVEHIASVPDDPSAGAFLNALRRPILGWIGHLGAYFDFDLARKTARAMPECTVVVGGPVDRAFGEKADELKKVRNIVMPGLVPYEVMPTYLRAFDVCLSFYRRDLPTIGSATKIFDWFAAGKPVVGRPCGVFGEAVDLMVPADTAREMTRAVSAVLAGDHADRQDAMKAYMGKQSWKTRAGTVLCVLQENLSTRS
jgi:glycosyltransferase involved in cell wall biosynthesis